MIELQQTSFLPPWIDLLNEISKFLEPLNFPTKVRCEEEMDDLEVI